MSKSTSNTTKQPPPTPEELERRSKLLCRNMTEYKQCSFGPKCHYSHELTRPVYDPRSHRREPSPPKQAPQPQTEEEIIKKFLEEHQFGKSAKKYLGLIPTMGFLQVLVVFNKSLVLMAPIDQSTPINKQLLVESMSLLMSSSGNEALKKFIKRNIDGCQSDADNLDVFNGIRTALAIPAELMNLFDVPETETGGSSYAGAVKVNQVELARKTPDAAPSKELIVYMTRNCGLAGNAGFTTMCQNHELLGTASAYKVRDFLAILTLHDAEKEVNARLEALQRQELAVKQEADVKVALMRECLTTGNPHLKTAFMLLTSLSELTTFASNLSKEEMNVFISVFGSFVAFLSHQVQTVPSFRITSEFLKNSFASFTKSRCVDQESYELKSNFCDFVKTHAFTELKLFLEKKTSSTHKKGNETLNVGEIFKRMLKEILLIRNLDNVKLDERDKFCIDLVKHILPFAYLLSLAPTHSNMLSGQWRKGFTKEEKLVEVYAYSEMSHGREKSILYWLLQGVRNKDTASTKKKASALDSFESLSSKFTTLKTCDNGQSKTVFNQELLFNALDEVLKTNFLKAGDFPVNPKSLQEQQSSLFKIDESGELGVSIPDPVAYCLYLGYGSSQDDLKTRQFSDMTALFKCDRKFLVEVVSSCNSSSYESPFEKAVAILKMMKLDQRYKNTVSEFMDLLDKSQKDDLLRRAYDVMSLAHQITCIQGPKFFMSLVDALLVVLLQDKFKNVKFSDIVNMVYTGKNNMDDMKFSFQKVKNHRDGLGVGDTMKQRLTDLLCEGAPRSNEVEIEELKKIVQSVYHILCTENLPDVHPHETFKRILPFILDQSSLTLLLNTVRGFERVEADRASPDITNWLAQNVQSFFDRELENFISGQAHQISFDLAKRMKEAVLPADRLKAVGFAKFQSSIVNLINSIMSSIGLPYKLTHETFSANFPKTTRCKNPEELIAIHAMKILTSSDGEVVQVSDQTRSLLQQLILKAVHAVCRTEVQKPKEVAVKVETVLLSFVKTELSNSPTIVQFFNKCLPYWKLDFVRELILGVLQHFYSLENVEFIQEIYTLVQKYGVQFSEDELETYTKLFTFLKSNDVSLPKSGSYEMSDDDFLQAMLDSIKSDHWNDTKQVEVSKPVVRKASKEIRIVRDVPPDSGIAVGGGLAPEPETFSEEDDAESEPVEQSKGPCNIATLRTILESDVKQKAIEYMNSVLLDDETLKEILDFLESEDSNCDDARESLNQNYE